MIENQDIDRLLTEIVVGLNAIDSDDPIDDWIAENELTDEVINHITDNLIHLTFSETLSSLKEGVENVAQKFTMNLRATILMSFILGWETSKQYGKPLTTP